MHVLYLNVSEHNSKSVSVGGKCILRGNVPVIALSILPTGKYILKLF